MTRHLSLKLLCTVMSCVFGVFLASFLGLEEKLTRPALAALSFTTLGGLSIAIVLVVYFCGAVEDSKGSETE